MQQPARWYVLQVYAGFEKKTAEMIRENAEREGLSDRIEEVFSPSEEVTEVKNGRRTKVTRNLHGGYLYIKAVMDEDLVRLVRAVPRVSGFLGAEHKPRAVPESEVRFVKKTAADEQGNKRPDVLFEIAESVRVVDGPFQGFTGFVDEVFPERRRLKVMVAIFGRETPVDLEYDQVVKV